MIHHVLDIRPGDVDDPIVPAPLVGGLRAVVGLADERVAEGVAVGALWSASDGHSDAADKTVLDLPFLDAVGAKV